MLTTTSNPKGQMSSYVRLSIQMATPSSRGQQIVWPMLKNPL
jgi:hypothetical protein